MNSEPSIVFRRGNAGDLPAVYRMQDVPYRERVFAGPLPSSADFNAEAEEFLRTGEGHLFLLEKGGQPAGFTQLVRNEESWDILVWGRWLNTLIYCGLRGAFESVRVPAVVSEVRRDHRRVLRAYELFKIRKVGQASVPSRRGKFDNLHITDFFYYEMTCREYEERLPLLQKHSLPVEFHW